MGIWLVSQCFSGLSNAVSGYIFGNDQFQMTDKVSRNGASGGESTSKLGYLSDLIGRQPKSGQMGHFPGGAVTRTPYERLMDSRGICILQDIFGGGLGVRKAYGYRYEMRDPDQSVRDGFDLGDFLRSTLTGGLMGGLSGVAFYGMGKAVEVLKGSLSRGNKNAIPGTSKLIGVGEGEKFGIYAAKATPVEGYTDVIVHGAPPDQVGVMHNGEWRLLDHRSLAKFLNQDGGYTGGAIRLLSCGTGSTADGFAQNLSNKMGVKVMAPSDTIWAFPSGRLTIGPNQFNNSGQWNIFIPRKL